MAAIFISAFTLFVVQLIQPDLAIPGKTSPERGRSVEVVRFRLDPSRSSFMVHADRAGLAWFKGHSHRLAVREFSGEAALTLDVLNPASLEMNVVAHSIEETAPVFTQQQKDIIKKELEEIVLETEKYPAITFRSTKVTGALKDGGFDVEIAGDLTLHGVTRPIEIPARVTVEGTTIRAKGDFKLNRKKFDVNATNAFHGFVRIKHTLRFVFDIVATRID
jgi:polyisoprenoid-binding protein YceI